MDPLIEERAVFEAVSSFSSLPSSVSAVDTVVSACDEGMLSDLSDIEMLFSLFSCSVLFSLLVGGAVGHVGSSCSSWSFIFS